MLVETLRRAAPALVGSRRRRVPGPLIRSAFTGTGRPFRLPIRPQAPLFPHSLVFSPSRRLSRPEDPVLEPVVVPGLVEVHPPPVAHLPFGHEGVLAGPAPEFVGLHVAPDQVVG